MKRKDNGALTEDQVVDLISGIPLARNIWDTPEDREKAWKSHRKDLMARSTNFGSFDVYGYGTRPAGWWQYEVKVKPEHDVFWQFFYLREFDHLEDGEIEKVIDTYRDSPDKFAQYNVKEIQRLGRKKCSA